MKNKKGFTLIELLVTIALMLSILTIAIVSFINISNKKKEEAYKLVQEQIITASEQYFDSNEYLFEGLVDGSSGIISVGKLVSEDYLNKVTDPRTGKSINYCNQVKVTKENGRYKSNFIESNETECESNNSIIVSEPGAPGIELSFYKQDKDDERITVSNNDEWFNISKLGENGKLGVKVTGKTKNNGKIAGISRCSMDGKVSCTNYNHVKNDSSFEDNDTFGSETNEKTVCYKVTNISGKSASKCVTAKVDTVKPTCSANIAGGIVGNNGWYKGTPAPNVKFSATDNLSGMSDNYENDNKKLIVTEGKNKIYQKTYSDVAGNTCTISKTVSYDKTNPTCEITLAGKTNGGNKVDGVQWYIGFDAKVSFNITKSDVLSGINNSHNYSIVDQTSETSSTSKSITVYDNAGNFKTCTSPKYGIEKSVTIVFDIDKSNKAKSTRNDRNETYIKDFSKLNVFDTSKGACGYGNCGNLNKCYSDDNHTNKCGATANEYFAISCMYVYGHLKYFKATGKSVGTDVSITDETMLISGEIRRSGESCGHKNEKYNYINCGEAGGSTLVSKIYKYKSPAGNTSNGIRLITQYTADCTNAFPAYK